MLKRSQVLLFMGFGIGFWWVGMTFIRLAEPVVFATAGLPLIILYVLTLPVMFVTVLLTSALSRTPRQRMLEPVTIITFTAVFIDGVVIAWHPAAYGSGEGPVMRGAAWLLWAGASGLLWAWLLERR